MKKFFVIVLLAIGLPLAARAQGITTREFDPGDFTQNLRFEAGIYGNTGVNDVAGMFQLTYTRNFWGPFAWRGGLLAAGDGLGYDGYAGIPLSLSYCPGTMSFRDRLILAAEESIFDIIMDVITGDTDRIGEDILINLVAVLFRRTEFFAGVTPGWWYGPKADYNLGHPRFSTTLDAGMVLSIPIRRLSIDIMPTYHYSLGRNIVTEDGPMRHFFSIGFGLSWIF